MELKRLGTTGLYVSEFCLGTMTFGMGSDEPTAEAVLNRFLDHGGTFIDTANVYGRGQAEELLGRFLRGRRHRVILATKVRGAMSEDPMDRGLSRRHILDAIDASLRRLQTDYIDLYQIHYWDNHTPIEETLEALNDLVRAGKVRYLGCSNLAGWQLAKALGISAQRGWSRYVSLQPEYSLINRDIERELVPACLDAGVAIIPYSPLAGGILSGKYQPGMPPPPGSRGEMAARTPLAAQWQARLTERTWHVLEALQTIAAETGKTMVQVALRWVADKPGVTAPIIGASRPEQVDDNVGALGWQLTTEQIRRLDEASAIEYGYPYDFLARLNAVGPIEAARGTRQPATPVAR